MKKFAHRTVGQRALASVLSVSLIAAGTIAVDTAVAPAAMAQTNLTQFFGFVNGNIDPVKGLALISKGVQAEAGTTVNFAFTEAKKDVKATISFAGDQKFHEADFKVKPAGAFTVDANGALVIDVKQGDVVAGSYTLPEDLKVGKYTLNVNVVGAPRPYQVPFEIVAKGEGVPPKGDISFDGLLKALVQAGSVGGGEGQNGSSGDTLNNLVAQAGSISGNDGNGTAQGGSTQNSSEGGSSQGGSSDKNNSSEGGSSQDGSSSSILPILGVVVGLGLIAAFIGGIIKFLMNKAPAPMPMPAPAPAPAPAPELPAKDGHPVANPVHAAKDGHPVANPVHH